MPERDWAKDLKLCWQADLQTLWWELFAIIHELERTEAGKRGWTLHDESAKCLENARFMLEACEGWPAALKEIRRLRARINGAALELAVALNGFQEPKDLDWVREHVGAALLLLNDALGGEDASGDQTCEDT